MQQLLYFYVDKFDKMTNKKIQKNKKNRW